jgi:hypothetical protein
MKTQNVYLEHANITVNNLDSTTKFFQTAFPDFKVRGGGNNEGRLWIHLGNESTVEIPNEKSYEKNGFNHVGFVVTDVYTLAQRLLEAGFEHDYPKEI